MTQAISPSDKITCYIRRTEDWSKRYEFSNEFAQFWKIEKIICIWNDTFNISYIDFRKRLNQIQRENLSEIKFDRIVDQYEYSNDGSIVVPTDDDDWISPEIIDTLRSHKKPVMLWNFINYDRGRIYTHRPHKDEMQFIYESNNYSLINANTSLLGNHVFADCNLRGQETYINSSLTMHNRTIASLSLLKPICETGKSALLELYDTCRKPVTISSDMPPYFMKYVEKMKQLYCKELQVRKTLL